MGAFCEFVDLASDAALAIDDDSHIVAWNERAASLLGYAADEALDRPCYDILQAILPSGEPLCTPECAGKFCFDHHSPFAVRECSLRHRDGRWLRASISTLMAPTPDKDEADPPTVAVIFLQPKEEPVSGASADRQLRVSTFGRFGLSVADCGLPIDRWYRKTRAHAAEAPHHPSWRSSASRTCDRVSLAGCGRT